MSGLAASPPPPPTRMTADEFIAWATGHPDGHRCELVAGEVFRMAAERAAHARVKARVYRALCGAIERARLPCEAFPDGMAVRAADDAVYEPGALVRRSPPLPDDAVEADDPLVVVEALSPSTGARDLGIKLGDYLSMPSVRHYLVVDTRRRRAIHHERAEGGRFATRLLARGDTALLDPPGLSFEVADLFADLDDALAPEAPAP